MNKYFLSIGLMSGTSMDGIDVSIIKSDGEKFVEIIDDFYLSYEDGIRKKIKKIISLTSSLNEISKISKSIKKLEKKLTLYHYKACKLIINRNKNLNIDLIGFHGQTILHKPSKGYSIQIGDSKLLSRLTKTTVISNFRDNDILNGGQGAPLTPLYHKLILKKIKVNYPAAIINIGGIANITYTKNSDQIISFDTGPGNYLIDQLVSTNTKMKFDKNGKIARSGKLDKKILNKFLTDPYYIKKYPKSLDVKYFNIGSVENLSFRDACKTLTMVTVKSISKAVNSLEKTPKLIIVSGGGRKNKFIIDELKKTLKSKVILIDKFNLDGDFIESQAFAYLAIRSYLKKFISLPKTTGVKKPSLGGKIFKS